MIGIDSRRGLRAAGCILFALMIGCLERDNPGFDPDDQGCAEPGEVIDIAGGESGAVRCADDSIDLVAPARCVPRVAGSECSAMATEGTCETDQDCIERPHGRCIEATRGDVRACGCRYGCATSEDCAQGGVCLCAGVAGESSRCVPGECVVGDDCESGACGVVSPGGCTPGGAEVVCRRPGDGCRSAIDCPDGICAPGDDALACATAPVCDP